MWVRPLWGAAVLFFCGIALAQEAPPALPASTFHARSELVQLNVVVRDKAGAHIPGLKQSDFKVFEAGRPRDIAFFEEVHPQPLPPAEPGVFSNLSTSNERRSVTVILLDLLNTEATDQARARELLVSQFTKIKLTPNPTALFVLNSRGLQVVHDFTTDSAALAAALKRVALELQGLAGESPLPGTTPLEGSLTSTDWVDVLKATRTMLAAMNEPFQPLESSRRWTMTIGALAQIEDRKSVV